ncbi:hypothetical protein KVR01_007597 [Diaporthe batatas]|uniref:uncharacterized protein n=1 Tax=Diaporthe batatas TaxID=748121 RepID=UPI001D04A005|nr:uncharacterized protein KVR01_007597 [Diaporthe batatas]KAG8163119.1 hypothetical protein KVR01_007597 [Diaporthe batatas]
MLLLNTISLRLSEFQIDEIPPYATFCAKWGDGDVVYEDLCSPQKAHRRPGFLALQKGCSESHSRGFEWLWSDAVCINKKSPNALSQALNSLDKIYRSASLCLVHLHDLFDSQAPDFDVERHFSRCSWFEHVWMLPPLVFSKKMCFHDTQWNLVGWKSDLTPLLSRLTSINEAVLETSDALTRIANSTKMTWAAGLSSNPIEDAAYSLLGIFNVSMPIMYGEGVESFIRLQEEIFKSTTDYSLLAWKPQTRQPYRGLFAHSPSEYTHLKHRSEGVPTIKGQLEIQPDAIHVQTGLGGRGNDLLLPLYASNKPVMWVVLTLWDGIFVRNCTETVPDGAEISNVFPRDIRVRKDLTSDISGKISLHRDKPQEKRIPTSGHSKCHSASNRDCQDTTASSHIAWSAAAEDNEATYTFTGGVPGKRRPLGFVEQSTEGSVREDGERVAAPLTQSGSEAGDMTPGRSPTGSPSSRCGSSHSDLPSTLDADHPFAAVTGDLKAVLVDRFLSTCDSRPRKRTLLSWSTTMRKRPRLSWSDPYMDVELASDSEDVDTIVVHHSGERVSTFACPFYLLDKERHEKCLTRHSLSTIDAVKEHMWASHRRPQFCPICKETFATLRARDDHIRGRSCEPRDSPTFDGLTDRQIQQLARRGSRHSSRESQWYELWHVVSPSGPRPLSPYYSNEQEFRVVALRRFWEANGHDIISDFLRERNLQGWEVSDEERSLAILYNVVLHDAIDEVYRRFARATRN